MPHLTPPPRRRGLVALGLVFLFMGAALLGSAAWQYFGSNIVAQKEHRQLTQALREEWQTEPSPTNPTSPAKPEGDEVGEAFALARIARFGSAYEVPVVRGVDEASLARGIGWVPESARPGQVGNFVLAAHRVTHGEPFRNFPSLEAGDRVEVETRTHVYTYELRQGGTEWIVDTGDSWVTNPVPEEVPRARPTERLITLITCTDLYSSDRRSIVTGELVSTVKK